MTYSDFTAEQLTSGFGIKFAADDKLRRASPVSPSAWLTESLQIAQASGYGSDKSRTERLVSPLLLEIMRHNRQAVAFASGKLLDADPAAGLTGTCDFAASHTRIQDALLPPLFFVVTIAQLQDMELGLLECAAQLVGAARLNERWGKPVATLYGCATSGVEWRFMRLTNNELVFDNTHFCIDDTARLLGAFQHLISLAK